MTSKENLAQDINNYPLTLKVAEVAEILRIDLHNAYSIVKTERFPVITHGKRLIIPRDAFFRWLDNCGKPPLIENGREVLDALAELVAEKLRNRTD